MYSHNSKGAGFVRGSIVLATILMLSITISKASAKKYNPTSESNRVALIIGNSGYDIDALPNVGSDSKLIQKKLVSLGFKTTMLNDANRKQMISAIKKFGKSLKKNDVGLFYYAGHAFNYESLSYLLPMDGAELVKSKKPVRKSAVNIAEVISAMRKSQNLLNILILDSCRSIPNSLASASVGLGLAQPQKSGAGFFLAYATEPGGVAIDGKGKNSPFTAALADSIDKPGLSIDDVFQRVRKRVVGETNGFQTPRNFTTLTDSFYFAGDVDTDLITRYRMVERENAELKERVFQLSGTNSDQEKRAIIWEMLTRCDSLGSNGRASLELARCYQDVLEVDSENVQASTALQLVAGRYERNLFNAIENRKLRTAQRQLKELVQISPTRDMSDYKSMVSDLELEIRKERKKARVIATF